MIVEKNTPPMQGKKLQKQKIIKVFIVKIVLAQFFEKYYNISA